MSGRILISNARSVLDVVVTANGAMVARGRTDARGRFSFTLPIALSRARRLVVHATPRHHGVLNAVARSVRVR